MNHAAIDNRARIVSSPRLSTPPRDAPIQPLTHRPWTSRSPGSETSVVFLYFVIAGMANVMLGPALPLLAYRWGLPDAQLGTLFFAFFAGQVGGAWLAARRLGVSLLLGSAGSAAGFCALAFAGPATAHLWLCLIGLGLGAGQTAGNVLVGTLASGEDTRRGSAASSAMTTNDQALAADLKAAAQASPWPRSRLLALLNVSWGIGAIACPLWLRASAHLQTIAATGSASDLTRTAGAWFFLGLGAAFTVCAALIVTMLPHHLYRSSEPSLSTATLPWPIVRIFVVMLILYVGVENALGGWLPAYAERQPGVASLAGRTASVALCFWIAELVGRGFMAFVIKFVDERTFYRACLALLIATIAVLALVPRPSVLELFVITAVAALSLAPLFPLAISFLLARTGPHPHIGKVFAAASLGGTCLPWLTGVVSSHFASLRFGFAVPAIGAVMLLWLSRYLPGAASGPSRR